MSEQDRDLLTALVLTVLGALATIGALALPSNGSFTESPALVPSMVGACLFVTSVLLFARSWQRGGRLGIFKIGHMVRGLFSGRENQQILVAMVFVGLYIFVGVAYLGYYISSAIFMIVMFAMYVKRFKMWTSILLGSGFAVLLFLTFNQLFKLYIK